MDGFLLVWPLYQCPDRTRLTVELLCQRPEKKPRLGGTNSEQGLLSAAATASPAAEETQTDSVPDYNAKKGALQPGGVAQTSESGHQSCEHPDQARNSPVRSIGSPEKDDRQELTAMPTESSEGRDDDYEARSGGEVGFE